MLPATECQSVPGQNVMICFLASGFPNVVKARHVVTSENAGVCSPQAHKMASSFKVNVNKTFDRSSML
jgi:hypothetical protein